MPGVSLGDVIPNLEADSTHGRIRLHDFIDNSWTIMFSHPADFTPVCTTELGNIARYAPEFEKRGAKLLGVSNNSVEDHKKWIKDIEAFTGDARVNFPMIADPDRKLTSQLNMLDPDDKDSSGRLLPSRVLHIIGPDKRIKLSFLYPSSTGRNFDEVIRALDALQLAAKYNVATPANWKKGDPVVINPSISNEEAKEKFPQGFKCVKLPSGKDYLRMAQVP
ncbi:hypothetical protein O6H91_07G134800 [Diphasiastrum complanatum]|uniref:Uncharacterized protein n=1 Tax=Diphasiastrum complanatum TaxID=34168 RepID=A0ACC2D9U4_DIPCM|nr:hypothetical protein O6H91_07G134800 [Diphasiastrum complanatum]